MRTPAVQGAALRFISSRTHSVIDYGVGVLLILAPYVLGFADGTAAQWVPQALGALVIGQSLLTRYEGGVVGLIPMPVHLALDAANGVLLAASPWLFGFADRVAWPHLLMGLAEIAVVLMSRSVPTYPGTTPLPAE